MSHKIDMRTPKQKALEILEHKKIKVIMNGLWEIESLTEDQTYEVELVDTSQSISGYTCGCKAWKFSEDKECKHVFAVKIFDKGYTPKNIVFDIVSLNSTDLSIEQMYELINR
jgi:hypothetical protein